MSTSYVHEFAKLASVDDAYDIYEYADKLGGSPQRAMLRHREHESVISKKLRENRLAKMRDKNVADLLAGGSEVPTTTALATRTGGSGGGGGGGGGNIGGGGGGGGSTGGGSIGGAGSHAHGSGGAAKATEATGIKGVLARANKHKGKLLLGLGAAGAAGYAAHHYNKREHAKAASAQAVFDVYDAALLEKEAGISAPKIMDALAKRRQAIVGNPMLAKKTQSQVEGMKPYLREVSGVSPDSTRGALMNDHVRALTGHSTAHSGYGLWGD